MKSGISAMDGTPMKNGRDNGSESQPGRGQRVPATLAVSIQWKPSRGPQRYDEHRGKRGPASAPSSPQSVNQYPPVNSWFSPYCNSSESSRVARIFPLCRQPPAPPRRIAAAAWLLVPEGHRRKLAGGTPAPAGAAPGCRIKQDMPQRGIGEFFWAVRRRGQVRPAAMVRHPSPFLRCPAGARSHSSPLPGAASAADLPPANLLRRPSGSANVRARAETGNRRHGSGVPNLFGCGSAALCSWCLGGPSESARLHRCGLVGTGRPHPEDDGTYCGASRSCGTRRRAARAPVRHPLLTHD